jgi:CBS domain-containing protein
MKKRYLNAKRIQEKTRWKQDLGMGSAESSSKVGEYSGATRDRGTLDFRARVSDAQGFLMAIATTRVVTVPPTMTVKGAAETMTRYRCRRIPVTDPGTQRLIGIIGSSDIIEFLGGGEKYRLIEKKHRGNFLAAINESVREIMVPDVLTIEPEASIEEALKRLLASRVGGLVIVGREGEVEGIVTERDFVFLLADKVTGKRAGDYMTRKVITATPGMTLGDITKTMVRNSFRRLPVIEDGKLIGIVTTRSIIEFIGKNHIFSKIVENRVEEILKTRAPEFMKKEVPTVGMETDLGEVCRIMEEKGTGTVCIVKNGRLEGILTEKDILTALWE